MAKKKNVVMSLEKLARMVERGFDGVERKFEGVDRRFVEVDGRLDGIERRLDAHELVLKAMQNSFEEIARELRTNTFDLEQRVVRLGKRTGLRR